MDTDVAQERESKRRRLSNGFSHDEGQSPTTVVDKMQKNSLHAVIEQNRQQDDDTAKEIRCGITAFVSPSSPGFSGVLKQRYTDFLVNEILPNGKVLHLNRLGVDKTSKQTTQQAQQVATTSTKNNEPHSRTNNEPQVEAGGGKDVSELPMDIKTADEAELKEIFGETITVQMISLYREILQHPNRKPKAFKTLQSEPLMDKETRTKAHQSVRRIFSSKLETKTSQEDNSVGISRAQASVADRGGSFQDGPRPKNRIGWEELGGDYLHFTLYKENKDTMEVMYFLASMLKVNTKSFQFGGTKDRRAVTVQRGSAYRIRAEQMASVGRQLRAGSKVGDFEYRPHGLELGDLDGNEFHITLRDCHFAGEHETSETGKLALAETTLKQITAEFSSRGFINYYGLQRFGSFSASTDIVGTMLLQGDLKGAIDTILDYSPLALEAAQAQLQDAAPADGMQISSDDKARAEAIHIWQTTHNSHRALEKLPRKFSAESNLIRSLGFRDKRTNELTRLKDYQGALLTIPRNLRLMYVHAYQSLVWNHAATARWEKFGRTVVPGDLVIIPRPSAAQTGASGQSQPEVDEEGEPIVLPAPQDTAASSDADSIYERARPLTAADIESGRYTIEDIVLPLPGFDVVYPANEIGEFYKEFMASRKGGGLDPYNMRRSIKDLSLSGGYRKLLARAQGLEWEVKTYKSIEEQLVETDLDRLYGKRESKPKAKTAVSTEEANSESLDSDGKKSNGTVDSQLEDKIAVVLKMRLGSSTYATMALRELMKQGGLKAYKPDYGGGR